MSETSSIACTNNAGNNSYKLKKRNQIKTVSFASTQ